MDLNEVFENTSSKKSPASTVAVAFGTLVGEFSIWSVIVWKKIFFRHLNVFFIGGLGIGLTAVSLPFIFPFFRRVCLPYVPATDKQISNVLEALRGRSGTLIDLGSGDGRIVSSPSFKKKKIWNLFYQKKFKFI